MKVLYVTTVASTMVFFPVHIQMLLEEGHEVELASNCEIRKLPDYCEQMGLKAYHIPFSRSPLSGSNIQAYRQLKQLIVEGGYDIVHTHTPNASALVRLACRGRRKKGLKVFYTAHGFHFYKGAPLANWLLYYPVEWLCSWWTDTLITINDEDYHIASEKLHAKCTVQTPGVGVALEKFTGCDANQEEMRRSLEIASENRILTYVGELNRNKNQSSLLDMLTQLRKTHPEAKLMLVGSGPCLQELTEKAKTLGLEKNVIFTGFRSDVPQLLKASDIAVASSIREGFGLNIIEAMASGIPVVAYDNRGHRTIIEDGINGFLVPQGDHVAMAKWVQALLEQPDLAAAITAAAQERVKQYSAECAVAAVKEIYDTQCVGR